ncbi:hypothetical protein [Poseidonocella sp. HB161398]|uniref:hypothetical protein n=1 Tax=Poseidonocella sp. HB161398 TaxID=2320855 RepID=UPI001108505A|nr:hypothetical protein [Poseidonocella sp. HB161398]
MLPPLCAAACIVITVIPARRDIASIDQFPTMPAELPESVAVRGEPPEWDSETFLPARVERKDGPRQLLAAFRRSNLGDGMRLHRFVEPTALCDASMTRQTICEVACGRVNRQAFGRAFGSVAQVLRCVENAMRRIWEREALEMADGAQGQAFRCAFGLLAKGKLGR